MVFTIRYRIDQAIKLQDISKIVVITDAIPATKQIFNTSVYLYQIHSITISKNFRNFFKKNSNNSISFWNYPDSIKWFLYSKVNKELKYIKIDPILPSNVKIVDGGPYFIFSFHFYFIFPFFSFFIFLFLEQLGLGFISHAVTSVTNW